MKDPQDNPPEETRGHAEGVLEEEGRNRADLHPQEQLSPTDPAPDVPIADADRPEDR